MNEDNLRHVGPPGGPWLDIISHQVPVPTIEQVEQLVSQPYIPQLWGAAYDVLLPKAAKAIIVPGHKAVVGYFEKKRIIISLSFPLGSSGITALHTIEEHSGGPLPPGLAVALVAALSAKKPCLAPSAFAYYAKATPTEIRPPLNRQQIDDAAERWLNETLIAANASMPRNGIDRGQMLVMAATKLWNKENAKRYAKVISSLDENSQSHLFMLSPLAEAARMLHGMTKLEIAGHRLKLGSQAWTQYLEMVQGNISRQAVRFLCGSSFPDSNNVLGWLGDAPPNPDALVIEDTPSAAAWSRSLIRDAEENGVFIPSGGFRLAFPPDYPLREWGMQGLRIHADPEGLWVSTDPNRGENLFRWEPGTPLNPILITSKVVPLMDITLAALWRDIRVAGETVVRPRKGGKRRRKTKPKEEPTVRYLPRHRLIFHGEAREWGSPEEHEAIQRRRHGVTEHFRRLLAGQQASEGARKCAADFGYTVIPDGFTFVKPHVRGHGEGQEPERAVTVVAQGLQAATIFLDKQRG